jgi:hypothetical protein
MNEIIKLPSKQVIMHEMNDIFKIAREDCIEK